MSTPQFDIRIDTKGKVHVKVSGVSGEECVRLTDLITSMIGREDSRQMTAEYHALPGDVHLTNPQQVRVRYE